MDLVGALARARSPERPGPDTPAGPAVRAWPGPAAPLPRAGAGQLDLSELLRLSLAASDTAGRLRPAPSAGALHPVDAQLVVGADCAVPPGRYGYDPLAHRVHRLGPAPDDTPPGASVELSVTARRTVSHYGHRAWPLTLLDTGHAAAALVLAGRALGVAEAVPHLDGLTEEPLAVVRFGLPEHAAPDGPPSRGASAAVSNSAVASPSVSSRSVPSPAVASRSVSSAAVTSPSVPSAAVASRSVSSAAVVSPSAPSPAVASRSVSSAAVASPSAPPPAVASHPVPSPAGFRPAPHELLARRSAPPPLRGLPPTDALTTVLATAVEAGAGELSWCAAVGGPRPQLVAPTPDGGLRRLAAGEARPTLAAWAAGQAWIAETGAVLLGYGCPTDADAPRIRRTHLRAGFAVHLAHLAAVRHGLTARPVGSWQQADLGAALGAAPGEAWIVHGLALGTTHPEEKTS